MKVTAIKTKPIVLGDKLFEFLDMALFHIWEKSVLAVSSKIVAICEKRAIKIHSEAQKERLVKQEAEFYLPREYNQYGFLITINRSVMVASAGIDESNGNGYYILWPKDPQKSANMIRTYLIKRFHLQHVGVIITDSKLTPLRWGVTGVALAHSGFAPLYSYIGKPDVFGRKLKAEKSNIADSLATAAVAEMGEGNEQQPLATIEDLKFVHFQKRNPTQKELNGINIAMGNDVYSSLLTSVKWKKGKNNSNQASHIDNLN